MYDSKICLKFRLLMKSIYQVKKIEKLAFQALPLLHDKSKERSKDQHTTVSKWQNKLKISSLHFTYSINKFNQAFFSFCSLSQTQSTFPPDELSESISCRSVNSSKSCVSMYCEVEPHVEVLTKILLRWLYWQFLIPASHQWVLQL